MLAMSEDQHASFAKTVGRISDNLAVPRDARDAEIHSKVVEVREWVRAYLADLGNPGGGSGEFSQA